jgi:hypothetical protein
MIQIFVLHAFGPLQVLCLGIFYEFSGHFYRRTLNLICNYVAWFLRTKRYKQEPNSSVTSCDAEPRRGSGMID